MIELSNLEQALDYTRAGERDLMFKEVNGDSKGCPERSRQVPKELLFFPRKKLKMVKIRSGNWEPKSWFIEERLKEYATGLLTPTRSTSEGLTSGLRSAIVLEPNGDYIRLKGVNPRLYEVQKTFFGPASKNKCGDMRGLNTLVEACREQISAALLSWANFACLAIRPSFIELFFPEFHGEDVRGFIELYPQTKDLPYRLNTSNQDNAVEIIAKFASFKGRALDTYNLRKTAWVSAFKITGDTRLDEAIYELTKTEPEKDCIEARDELLRTLSFDAGISLARLNISNMALGGKLEATNSHLGNFVLDRNKRRIQINLCDLDAITDNLDFDENHKFWDHIQKDVENYREDFQADYTTSLPTSLRFKFFPNYLREQCFDCFRTGYAIIFANAYKRDKRIVPQIITPSRILVPDRVFLTEKELRDTLAAIQN